MFGRGREALPVVQEWWEALPDVRDWSGGPPGCFRVVRKPSRMFERGREALPVVREWWESLPDVQERSESPPGCPGTPLKFPGSLEGRPRSLGALLGCPGVLGRPSQMFRSGWDALPDVWEWCMALPGVREWSGDPAECPRVVVRPSRKFGRPSWKFGRQARRFGNGWDTLPDVPEGWEALPDVWQLSGGIPGCAGGPPFVREWSEDLLGCSEVAGRPSQMSGSGERPSRMSGRPRGFLKMVGKPF